MAVWTTNLINTKKRKKKYSGSIVIYLDLLFYYSQFTKRA
jgi:hypothetical protein